MLNTGSHFVIQRLFNNPKKQYIAYQVDHYFVSLKGENIVFEFNIDNQASRKWAPKRDIILLTEDRNLFIDTLDRLKEIELSYMAGEYSPDFLNDNDLIDALILKTSGQYVTNNGEHCQFSEEFSA